VDSLNGGIPFVSPSNKNIQCQAVVANNKEVNLSVTKAGMLNENGVVTAINWINGWVLWGNRMSCYPGVTDPKDTFVSSRRMLAWYGNNLITKWWQKVDEPMNHRLIQMLLNSESQYINSLVSFGALTGGRIEFMAGENPVIALIDGKVRFHVYLGLVVPAEAITFDLEFDPEYMNTLFG